MSKSIAAILIDLSNASLEVGKVHSEVEGLQPTAKQFGDLKKAFEAVKIVSDALAERWDECEKALVEIMIEEGVSSVKIDGYGNFILSRSIYPAVNAANKPTFFQYLRESGNEGLLKLDVATNTLTTFLKKHVEELKTQLTTTGITTRQAEYLSTLPEFEDAAKAVGKPLDAMDAADVANGILKSQGAAMFTKTGISLRK